MNESIEYVRDEITKVLSGEIMTKNIDFSKRNPWWEKTLERYPSLIKIYPFKDNLKGSS